MKTIFFAVSLFVFQLSFAQGEDPNLTSAPGGSTSFAPLAGDPANGACCSALQTSSEATFLNSANSCRTPNCGLQIRSGKPNELTAPDTAPTAN